MRLDELTMMITKTMALFFCINQITQSAMSLFQVKGICETENVKKLSKDISRIFIL